MKQYEYDAVIRAVPEKGGAYVVFPWDLREEFGKGRVKVSASFDGAPYQGSVVNMGLKNPDGSVCYIIGVKKEIREKIGKQPGDRIHVVIRERDQERQAMWTCPQCGRSFKNTDQSHYCKKPENIDEYIAMQPEDQQPRLERLRAVIAAAIPQAGEGISWSMPTFRGRRAVIQFAGFKNHIGLYPGPEAVEAFSERLDGYKFSKGTIQLPNARPLPETLIADIACWCWEQDQSR